MPRHIRISFHQWGAVLLLLLLLSLQVLRVFHTHAVKKTPITSVNLTDKRDKTEFSSFNAGCAVCSFEYLREALPENEWLSARPVTPGCLFLLSGPLIAESITHIPFDHRGPPAA